MTEFFGYRNYEFGFYSYAPYSLKLNALTLVGNVVGAFTAVFAPSAVTHEISAKNISISSSIFVADIPVCS